MGNSDLGSIASHGNVEIAALCDVDANTLASAQEKFPKAKAFKSYREMISEMGDEVDGVVVSTPDHTHAPAAMTALNAGKHVYCQKPLTHEIYEARQLRLVAEKNELVTQMGVQIHSNAVYRKAVMMVQSGVIGKVSEVHAWSNKNWGYDGGEFAMGQEPPKHLDWNLWLDTANERPFVEKVYHPGQWRKIVEFGTGTLGDMGVHIFDTPYTALELTAPNWVKTSCRKPTNVGHPEKNLVEYEFPGTAYTTETMVWKWYDGKFAPPSPTDVGLPEGTRLPGQGALFIGEAGQLLLPHIGEPILMPEEKFAGIERPQLENNNHYHQWVDTCAGEDETSMSFSLGGPLTEALLLGVVANRFPDETLKWDAENLVVTNIEKANELIRRTYRAGFEVEGL
jgi:predicted dehydrogenase